MWISTQKRFECGFYGNPWRQECPFHLERKNLGDVLACGLSIDNQSMMIAKDLGQIIKFGGVDKTVLLPVNVCGLLTWYHLSDESERF